MWNGNHGVKGRDLTTHLFSVSYVNNIETPKNSDYEAGTVLMLTQGKRWMEGAFTLLFWWSFVMCLQAGPLEDLKSYDLSDDPNLLELLNGEIQISKGPILNTDRALTSALCYIVKGNPDEVVKFYQTWDASEKTDGDVQAHHPLSLPPAESDFDSLDLNQRKMFKWFVDKMREMEPNQCEFHMSDREMARSFRIMKDGGTLDQKINLCWKEILFNRASLYHTSGLRNLPSYQDRGVAYPLNADIMESLRELPSLEGRFKNLLSLSIRSQTGPSAELDTQSYWELAIQHDKPTILLGAHHVLKSVGSRQMLDVIYYTSNGIYGSLTFREIWPMQTPEGMASLVYRRELVIAPELANISGVERMAAGTLMAKEMKKNVEWTRKVLQQKKLAR